MSGDFVLNLVELGHFSAILAMVVVLIQGVAPMLASGLRQPRLLEVTRSAAIATFVLTSIGGFILIHAFVASNFSVEYVARNSNTLLPIFYKVTALWGSHEGSLYLWLWILTLFTAIIAWHGRRRYAAQLPVILAVQGWLSLGFFGLILFLSNPFNRLVPAAVEGNDLNPLLQDPGMVFHPPMLYLGYVGFSVPFAFALAALITRWKSELWTGWIRYWALIAWAFLTAGIILGGWWAYYELGWGGYWAWDPVENASFMPWLLGTALIHSITVQDRRRMLHAWNIFLVITTFSLSLLGTFLVRSGVLSSVHAFAVDPGRGAYILIFMTLVLTVSFGIFLVRGRYQQAEESITSFLSRESLFVWNNVIFTVACAVVLLGTLYPLALEALTSAKITVGAPYFNSVMIPIFLVTLLLMAVGPLIPWRKARSERVRRHLLVPGLLGLAAALGLLVFAWPVHWTGPAAVGLVALGLGSLVTDLWRTVQVRRRQHQQEGIGLALARTVGGNRRHYGGMLVHFGILVIAVGMVGSGLFRAERSVAMAPGDVLEIGGETLRFEGVSTLRRHNYEAVQGRFTLINSGRVVTPERRQYPRQQMPTTEAGIDSTPLRDVYLVMSEAFGDGKWAIHAYVNPLVQLIWAGGIVLIAGILLSLSSRPSRSRREALAREVGAHA